MMGSTSVAMVSAALIGAGAVAAVAPEAPPVAVISLFNPTGWAGPTPVEVPVGRVASPGLLDWRTVGLRDGAQDIPFALREGRPHWRASLAGLPEPPRAEDLVVFSCVVPPGTWRHIAVVPGGAPDRPVGDVLQASQERIVVDYPGIRVVVDAGSGALLDVQVGAERLLAGSFLPTLHPLSDKGYELVGGIACGYQLPAVNFECGAPLPASARLVSACANAALAELNWVLEAPPAPALALTYRVHAAGWLEVAVDERPWSGASPWTRYAVQAKLSLLGEPSPIPLLEDRSAFYGFKEYAAATRMTACWHRLPAVTVLELGDETINGRHYGRRLFAVGATPGASLDQLAELVDEGLVVDVRPLSTPRVAGPVAVTAPATVSSAVVEALRQALRSAGLTLAAPEGAPSALRLDLDLAPPDVGEALAGDGFRIAPGPDHRVDLRARILLGLAQAVRTVARSLACRGPEGGIPLVSRNPVVDLRAGGFGGGDFEVDFPYGSDDEWRQTFDGLLDSGMNVFTCLGMWGNWKMPVGFAHLPELRSDDPAAYDESSGARLAELEPQRQHGLALTRYLQERGGQVWLWVPVGCVPTTFAKRFPQAMAPSSDKTPCFTHPEYRRYVDAFLRELIETYPLQGLVLIRDDNGGICTCDRCRAAVAASRTGSPVWEQYLLIYDWLRANGFRGAVAVYPYNDPYLPGLDPLLPEDLYVLGHGGGAAVLTRRYESLGPMGDTWLDNLYANFRLPPSPRLRRLLAGRGSFWIGGAYRGTELPWESVGYFGWEPTATPNSLRYDWGRRTFGEAGALPFLRLSERYEYLWDLNALPMLPLNWVKLGSAERQAVVQTAQAAVAELRTRLAELEQAAPDERHRRWFGHLRLFAPFFEYHLQRLDRSAAIYDRVCANRAALDRPEGLPPDVRAAVLADYAALCDAARPYEAAMQQAPNGMLARCRWMTRPYKEWMAGYDQWLDWSLEIRQFAGAATATADPAPLRAGETFVLRIELHNRGVCPWVPGLGQRLELTGATAALGLPSAWEFDGPPVAPGDRRVVELRGTAPREPGQGQVDCAFLAPYRAPERFITCTANLAWQ
jgi:hypothetical protein